MDSDIYKTLEAVGWELGPGAGDQDLAAFAEETTALLEKAQQPDGYLNSCVQVTGRPRYSNLAHSHELYCAGHLIQAAVACQRGRPADRLLGVAQAVRRPPGGHVPGPAGGPTATRSWRRALVELYRETGAPAVPRAGQPVHRAARAQADRRLRVRRPLPAGSRAGPASRAPRSGTWSARCTWKRAWRTWPPRPATRRCWQPRSARWADMVGRQDVPDRRQRVPA